MLPAYVGKGFEGLLISVAIAYILSALLSFITFKDPVENSILDDMTNNENKKYLLKSNYI